MTGRDAHQHFLKALGPMFASLSLLASAACQAAPDVSGDVSGPTIPRSTVALEHLVFLPQQVEVAAVRPGVYDICRDGAMTPQYRVSSISAWTGQIFRTARITNDLCQFSVQSMELMVPTQGDIETADCVTQIALNGSAIESIRAFVRRNDPLNYFQCEYRLSMAFIGYVGALSMDEAVIFRRSDNPAADYGAPFRAAFSSVMPAPFVHLQWKCRGAGTPYVFAPGLRRPEVFEAYNQANCFS